MAKRGLASGRVRWGYDVIMERDLRETLVYVHDENGKPIARSRIMEAPPNVDPRSLSLCIREVEAYIEANRECDETCAPHLFQFCSPECEARHRRV